MTINMGKDLTFHRRIVKPPENGVGSTLYLDDAGEKLSSVRGVIGIAGPYDFLPLTDPTLITIFGGAHREDILPITYVDGKRPAMLLAAGDDDKTVGPGNTTRMAAKLQVTGSPVEVHLYPGISHVGIILSLAPMLRSNTTLRQDMIDFVNWIHDFISCDCRTPSAAELGADAAGTSHRRARNAV